MDFQSAMETFAEAWVAANTKSTISDVSTQNQALALTKDCKTPPSDTSPYRESSLERERTRTPLPDTSDVDVIGSSPVNTRSVKYDLSKSSGKSLPVHCVVETIYTLEEPPNHSAWRRRHVAETDSLVFIPANTIFHELVQVALQRLGYSSDSASAARGSVVIKNWKPLTFDKIADGPLLTVGDILGELSTVATLRIQVFRARPSPLADIKDKLLRLLLVQSHHLLISTGCPLDEVIMSQICRSHSSHCSPEPSEELCRKFDQWLAAQGASGGNSHGPNRASDIKFGSNTVTSNSTVPNNICAPPSKLERSPPLSSLPDHVHPAIQIVQSQYPTQKTRMRTSFDPELELPKLQSWFAENQHPSRQQIQLYVKELNGLESRRGRKPLDINNVVYWFKNARAAQKRAETRGGSGIGQSCHLNGYGNMHLLSAAENYLHDSLSMKSPGNMNREHHTSMISNDISNDGSDLEDDDGLGEQQCSGDEDQPQSPPSVPLSLTTTSRNHNSEDRNSEATRNSSPHSPTIDVIKQEQNTEDHPRSPLNNNNNNNNNHKKERGDESDVDEDSAEQQHKNCNNSEEHLYQMEMNRASLHSFRTPTPDTEPSLMPHSSRGSLDRIAPGFPLTPNSMFSNSFLYYIPGLPRSHHGLSATSPSGSNSLSHLSASMDERRKRNRTFIDPVTEVPRLEQWFSISTHPSHNMILKYTEELNRMPYRQKFPRLEPKNVQFWFKNRRAKCKRLKMALYDNPHASAHPPYHHSDRE